jgi:hypothetical protein
VGYPPRCGREFARGAAGSEEEPDEPTVDGDCNAAGAHVAPPGDGDQHRQVRSPGTNRDSRGDGA